MKRTTHGGNIYEIANNLGIPKEEIIDYSANINPLGIPDSFKRALTDQINIIENYPDPEYGELIHKIAKYNGVKEEYVTVGNGATEVIFSLICALMPKKSLILAPTFSEYERALRKVESEVFYYDLKEEYDFRVDEDFYNELNEDIDLVVLCNPNNPTGQLIQKNEMVEILKVCKKKNIHLIVDEAFIDFVEDPHVETVVPWINDYKNLYIIRALTKFFALPGLRIGYGITSNERVLKYVADHKEPWTINSYAALAGEIVLEDREYIEKSRNWITSERDRFYNELKRIHRIKVYRPRANYIFFRMLDEKIDLKEKFLEKKILIRSCSNYKNLDHSYYRIAIKDKDRNEKFIHVLKEVLYES